MATRAGACGPCQTQGPSLVRRGGALSSIEFLNYTRTRRSTNTQTCALSLWFFYPFPELLGGCERYHYQTAEKLWSHWLLLKSTTAPPPCVCVCACARCQNACAVIQVEVDGDWPGKGVRCGKNSISYQLLPARPMRGKEAQTHIQTLET